MCEIPLRVTQKQEKIIEARLEAGRQFYNALLGECVQRMRLMRESKTYQMAVKMPKGKTRNDLFQALRIEYGFTEYDLSRFATTIRQSWIGEHIGAHVGQKLVTRAYEAVAKVAYGKAKKVRFKGKRGLHSLEGKNNQANLFWREDHIVWNGLELPMMNGSSRDPVIQHGLSSRIKYVRLVKKELRGKNRYYAQLVCEGHPAIKANEDGERIHLIGSESVGLDIGPSTIAIVGDTKAELALFAEAVVSDHRHIRKLQRKQDRQRRANNPDCYDALGRAIKGKHPTKKSEHQRDTEAVLRELHRRESAHRKTLHGQLANEVIAIGTKIKTEKLSYKAFQKLFGRSIGIRAPKTFLSILTRKAESAGGQVEEFGTYHTALSQTCICGQKHKKRLSERVHACDCGVVMQRDLFSAYLAKHVEEDCLQVANANMHWQGAEPLLRTAWRQVQNQPASGRPVPSSFGTYRSQSGSPEKESLPEHEVRDVVATAKVNVRACESAKV